jgi:hypothetical protein
MGRVSGVLAAGAAATVLNVVGAGPAAAAVSARTPSAGGTVFVHSAQRGELGGGRLTLRGVGSLVTWSQPIGRSGVLSITRMHRLLFSSGNPATGTLHVAGQRGRDELTFTLTHPRYAHGTVSYRVRRLNRGRLPGRGARAAQSAEQFGAASLSIVGGTAGPSVTIDTSSYGCNNSNTLPPNTCWGAVSGSGLKPGANWTVESGGNFLTNGKTDKNGAFAVQLVLPCGGFSNGLDAFSTAPGGGIVDTSVQSNLCG